MQIARQLLVFIAASALGILLLALAAFFSLNLAFGKPDNLKRWLGESSAYDTFVSSVLAQGQGASSLPLDRPEVQEAARQAFNPRLLQASAETVIDNSYRWLSGETDEPDFRIDFQPAKTDFANRIGDYARQRLANLPPCADSVIPRTTDPFAATCQPVSFNVDYEPEIQRLTAKLAATDEYLADPVITAQNLTVPGEQGGGEVPFFARYDQAPAVFQLLRLAPFIVLGLIGLAGVVIILGSRPRRKGVKRIGLALLSGGGFLLVSTLLLRFLPAGLDFSALPGMAGGDSAPTGLAASLATALGQTASRTFLIFSALYLGAGLALLLASRLRRRRTTQAVSGNGGAPAKRFSGTNNE